MTAFIIIGTNLVGTSMGHLMKSSSLHCTGLAAHQRVQ